MFLRTPCKNLKPYDNPFWGFEQLCWCMGVDLDLSKLKSTVSELLWVLAWSLLFPTGNDGIVRLWSRIMKNQKVYILISL